ncbi:MAG: hypothetical protein GX601_04765 [Anaerolineales bacterium]|nr:hypothetical protein [Anaerolineales bacterium]
MLRTVGFGIWYVRGVTILNAAPMISIDHNVDHMQRTVRLLENGTFDQRQLVPHRHSAMDAYAALSLAAEWPAAYIKGVLLLDM